MNYEYWRQKSVYFASNEHDIDTFLSEQYPGFDLEKVLSELDVVAANRGFAWDRIQIDITTLGNLHIQHHYDTQNHDEEPLRLRRILRRPTIDGRRVSHEEMVLPESMRNQGISRDLIRPYYKQYQSANVDCIDVNATLSGGGYAWAKYGFDAVNQTEVFSILNRARASSIDNNYIDILMEDVALFYASHPSDTPFRIWAWSQTPFARELLVGTTWQAVLNLHDPEQVSIFEEYLYSTF